MCSATSATERELKKVKDSLAIIARIYEPEEI